jgi:hypothetical protein
VAESLSPSKFETSTESAVGGLAFCSHCFTAASPVCPVVCSVKFWVCASMQAYGSPLVVANSIAWVIWS